MKKLSLLTCLLALLLTACGTTSYSFEEYGISFEYPSSLILSEMGEAVVTIDTMDWTGFEGGPPPLTNVSVLPDMSTEDTINTYYKNSDQLSTEDVQFGENISTKVTYFSEYIDGYNERTVYLTEMNSVTVVVSEGNNEELAKKNTTQMILESLQAN